MNIRHIHVMSEEVGSVRSKEADSHLTIAKQCLCMFMDIPYTVCLCERVGKAM